MKLIEIFFLFFELLSILIYDELCFYSLSYLVKLNLHSPAEVPSHVWGLQKFYVEVHLFLQIDFECLVMKIK